MLNELTPLHVAISVISSIIIGFSGVLPAFFIASDDSAVASGGMNRWLSFAAGSLLGDVFIHILPETIELMKDNQLSWSLLVVGGAIAFFAIEKIAGICETYMDTKDSIAGPKEIILNGSSSTVDVQCKIPKIIGYLNLFANSLDNFSHGTSVGGGFAISLRCGLLTTSCLLIHEIPHEMMDFVILLRSGFSRWDAIKAQLITASTCLIGSCSITIMRIQGQKWMVILPFTAGGFLYISLVSLMPTVLQERDKRESLIHMGIIGLGVASMYCLNCVDF